MSRIAPHTPAEIIRHEVQGAAHLNTEIGESGGAHFDELSEDKVRDAALRFAIGVLVSRFSVAFLMETLRRTDPEVAEAAADRLGFIHDDGEAIHDLLVEWVEDIEAGRGIASGRSEGWHEVFAFIDEVRGYRQEALLP